MPYSHAACSTGVCLSRPRHKEWARRYDAAPVWYSSCLWCHASDHIRLHTSACCCTLLERGLSCPIGPARQRHRQVFSLSAAAVAEPRRPADREASSEHANVQPAQRVQCCAMASLMSSTLSGAGGLYSYLVCHHAVSFAVPAAPRCSCFFPVTIPGLGPLRRHRQSSTLAGASASATA